MKRVYQFLMFSQAKGLIQIGRKRVISESDVFALEEDIANIQFSNLDSPILWQSKWSTIRTLFHFFRTPFWICFAFLVLAHGTSMLTPVLVNRLIQGLVKQSGATTVQFDLITFAVLLGLVGYISGLFMQHYIYKVLKLKQKMISLLNKSIFNQSIELNFDSREQIAVGDVVNYMSSDSESIAELSNTAVELVANTLLILASMCLLFWYLGSTAFISIAIMLLLLPITFRIGKHFTIAEGALMKHQDDRLNILGQTLGAIRLIKYYVWEMSICNRIGKVRDAEIRARWSLVKAESISMVLYVGISNLVVLVTLYFHSQRGQEVNLTLAFTVLSIFAILEEPFANLTSLISRAAIGLVGAQRLSRFMLLPTFTAARINMKNPGLKIQKLNFHYAAKPQTEVLSDVSFSVGPGESLAIIGEVGCGKSTLLQLLLRELHPQSGDIRFTAEDHSIYDKEIPSDTAFVTQESYILNASLRDNLIFGSENVSESLINEALHTSCFSLDIKLFEHGLETELGERGINLSGGQKQRLCLARAFIKNPEFILLDDPLSAVDIHTEKLLCDRLLFGSWQDKTRVVVTHRLDNLYRFDRILLLNNGRIKAFGTFEELIENSISFREFYQGHHAPVSPSTQKAKLVENDTLLQKKESVKPPPSQSNLASSHRITEDEERQSGSINKDLYLAYVKLLGGQNSFRNWILMGLAFSAIMAKTLPLLERIWLSKINHMESQHLGYFFSIYAGLGFLSLSFGFGNNLLWFRQGIQAAIHIHNKMLKAVLGSKIRFFDSTPVGRILQRFSRDQESLDVHLMFSHLLAVDCLVQVMISIILILATLPIMFLSIIPLLVYYYRIQDDYRKVAREVKRMDSIARSPRYAHFKETIQGLVILRAYGKQNLFQEKFWKYLQYSQKMFYNHYMVNRWFSVRIPLIGGIVATSTAVVLVYSSQKGLLMPSVCGLVLIYSMTFWRQLNFCVRIFSEIEARMTSVERLQVYCELPQEQEVANLDLPTTYNFARPPLKNGEIEFQNVSLRYASHLPLVLHDVSFSIESGERIGIIGRTGSGKSTLLQALYRFVDIESGSILIGGKSILDFALPELRKSLAIIPQDPTLFLGTLRTNLDPYNEYSEEALREVLLQVHLWKSLSDHSENLDAPVSENGMNFSQGQRQLICLARALLVKAQIIILDEATASIDIHTDEVIQQVLDSELGSTTQLIIAHRMNTLKRCNKILTFEKGQIISNIT